MEEIKLENGHSIKWHIATSADSGDKYILYTKHFKGVEYQEECSLSTILDNKCIYVYDGETQLEYTTKINDNYRFMLSVSRDEFTRADSGITLKLVIVDEPNCMLTVTNIHYCVYTKGHFIKDFSDFTEAFNFAFT